MKLYNKVFFIILLSVLSIAFACFCLFTLASCTVVEKEDVVHSLTSDLWTLLTHLFATIILVGVCTWLGWKPTKKFLDKKKKEYDETTQKLQKINQEVIKQLNEANEEKINAHLIAEKIVDDAKKRAYEIVEKNKVSAQTTAKKIIDEANLNLHTKEQQWRSQVKQQVIDIAFIAAKNVLDKQIEKDESLIIDQQIDSLIEQIVEPNNK